MFLTFFWKYFFSRMSMVWGITRLSKADSHVPGDPLRKKERDRCFPSSVSVSLRLSHSQAASCSPSLPPRVLGGNFSRQMQQPVSLHYCTSALWPFCSLQAWALSCTPGMWGILHEGWAGWVRNMSGFVKATHHLWLWDKNGCKVSFISAAKTEKNQDLLLLY